jgi:hypothetical protein
MNNFFDINSPEGQETLKEFDWNSARAYEKLDGALIAIYYYQNEWRIGSRFSPDGGWLAFGVASQDSNYSWKELTIKTIEEYDIKIDDFFDSLNKNIFYSFELCTNENQVGVIYKNNTMSLIAAVDKDTLNEIDIEELDCLLPKAKYIEVQSLDDVMDLIGDNEAHQMEGFVVKDKNFNRLKIYNPKYLEAMNSFGFKNTNEALSNLFYIFMVQATYAYDAYGGIYYIPVDLPPQSLDTAPINNDNILLRLIVLGNWMQEQVDQNNAENFAFWPEFFTKLQNGEPFSELILDYDNDYVLAKINQFESNYLNS